MDKKIKIIDETLREGMQYRGVMFSVDQRLKILEYQEKLCVDICQAGYPPAHASEMEAVGTLCRHSQEKTYNIRVAGMGRAIINDANILLGTGTKDFHFHIHIRKNADSPEIEQSLQDCLETINFVRKKEPDACFSIAMLDIGNTTNKILEKCISFFTAHHVDILSLPDTSGIMAPNRIFEKIRHHCPKTGKTALAIHCHNDMGMASANSVMGILGGGKILEASVLGIGERNGIADLFTTAKMLQTLGYSMHLNIEDIDTFKAYYDYVDGIVYEQLNLHLKTINTPFFGDAVKTHVAGTHAAGNYGIASEETFFLNSLCGRYLVKKYLAANKLQCPENLIDTLTSKIKSKSSQLNRCLSTPDIKKLISSLRD